MRKIVAALAGATLASGFLFAGGAVAAHASAEPKASESPSTKCTWVRQYDVIQDGDLVDRNGNVIGAVYVGDVLNARELNINYRHWGYVAATGKYGGVLTSKLNYRGDACV
jgi:hypothetical protein